MLQSDVVSTKELRVRSERLAYLEAMADRYGSVTLECGQDFRKRVHVHGQGRSAMAFDGWAEAIEQAALKLGDITR